MRRVMLWVLAIALIAAGAILHVFYVDYESAAKAYIFSWPANSQQRANVISREAGRLVRPAVTRADADIVLRRMDAHRKRWCRPTPAYSRLSNVDKFFAAIDDAEYWRCEVPFDRKQVLKDATRTFPGVTPEQALARVNKAYKGREILHGMVPAKHVRGLDREATALWLGVLAPLGLFVAALLAVIASFLRPAASKAAYSPGAAEPLRPKPKAPGRAAAAMSMADSLRAAYGADFPVTTGNGTADDPLVVTERRDYVGIEFAAVRHALEAAGEEFQLDVQNLLHQGGREVDEMVFRVRRVGTEEWTGTRRFYFDITDGFNRI